jgi:dihydrolipoamide dehydrogenase
MAEQFDVVVIGGGPGGYVAAIRAAQLGLKTALVEKEHLGGVCLNWGCIPTKALLRSAEIYTLLRHAEAYGLKIDGKISFDLQKIVERSRKIAKQLSNGVNFLLKKHKVKIYDGVGRLTGQGGVEVAAPNQNIIALKAKHIILATGARPRILPGLEPDGQLIVTAKEAMIPKDMPKALLVIGSGAIGVEFASFYRSLGSEVTLVEVMERILPVEDEEISALARKAFEKQGMRIITGAKVSALRPGAKTVEAVIEGAGQKQNLEFDRVIVAVGIIGNTENLGLEHTKIKVEKGQILTDGLMRTAEPGVYAIGDVAGAPWLAHKASHEGVLCVEAIAGHKVQPMAKANIPGCTYCHPQIASVGLTEAKAKASGYEVKVGRFPFIGNGKAIALGEPEGLVKTVFDAKTGELLGAHMIGAEVTELIQGYGIAKTLETTEAELMHTVFPHPTLSEMLHESVLDAYARALHI